MPIRPSVPSPALSNPVFSALPLCYSGQRTNSTLSTDNDVGLLAGARTDGDLALTGHALPDAALVDWIHRTAGATVKRDSELRRV